jgi:short-subunit dehydrogenase
MILVACSLESLYSLAEQLRSQYQVKIEVLAGDISDSAELMRIIYRVEQSGIQVSCAWGR